MSYGRVDPVLKLFPGCPMMLMENKDVHNGKGLQVRLKKVEVRAGETRRIVWLVCGTKVCLYFALQLLALTVQHEVGNIVLQDFQVVAKVVHFQVNLNIKNKTRKVSMKGTQFPCTMLKRQAVVIFPEVNYELSLVMINQLSKNSYTAYSMVTKCIDHAYSMVTKYKQLNQLLAASNLGRRISTAAAAGLLNLTS
jgi:hypothetical protein